jgi:hypothetical protein
MPAQATHVDIAQTLLHKTGHKIEIMVRLQLVTNIGKKEGTTPKAHCRPVRRWWVEEHYSARAWRGAWRGLHTGLGWGLDLQLRAMEGVWLRAPEGPGGGSGGMEHPWNGTIAMGVSRGVWNGPQGSPGGSGVAHRGLQGGLN